MSARTQQLQVMVQLQNEMNIKVNADWQQQGYEWYRAIWVECAELMDHYGWKWWKKQAPDEEQVALELIDIWHFGLSMLLQSGQPLADIVRHLDEQLIIDKPLTNFREELEKFVAATLTDHQFHIGLFGRLMAGVNMNFDKLYCGYIGKNVLNFFRQDHGYKEGSYRKSWYDGREDNEHLVDIIQELDVTAPQFKDALYAALLVRYQNNLPQ